MLNYKNKRKTMFILCLSMLIIIGTSQSNIYGASAHVIYEVDWLSDNSAKVNLKWSDETIQTPIRITSWKLNANDTITIRYQQGSSVITGFNSRTITDDQLDGPRIILLSEELGQNQVIPAVFPDLPKDSEGSIAIQHLYYLGIVNGYTNGTFLPEGKVSRAEFSKMLYLGGKMTTNLDSPITFSDVASSHWARNYIYTLASKEIVKGKGNNIFDPSGTITLGEVLAILDRSFILFESSSAYSYNLENHWSNGYFSSLVSHNIVLKSDHFYYPYTPSKIATRKDCALLLSRVLETYHEVNK